MKSFSFYFISVEWGFLITQKNFTLTNDNVNANIYFLTFLEPSFSWSHSHYIKFAMNQFLDQQNKIIQTFQCNIL